MPEFSPRSMLVTGGAGYIGSHIVRALRREGYRPVILDDLREGHRAAVADEEIVQADIAAPGALERILRGGEVVGCVHMAARCLVGESMERPRHYYRENFVKSLALLDALVENGVGALVFSSSAAVYGEPAGSPITEDFPLSVTNPYLTVDGVSQGFDAYYRTTDASTLSVGSYTTTSLGGARR